jgi:hypothetical protein
VVRLVAYVASREWTNSQHPTPNAQRPSLPFQLREGLEDCEDRKRDRTAGPLRGHGEVKAAFMTGAGPNSIAWRVRTDDAE